MPRTNPIRPNPMLFPQDIVNRLGQFYNCLKHEVRRDIINLLLDHEELSVQEISEALGQNQPTISKFCSMLRKSKILLYKREGGATIYRINKDFPLLEATKPIVDYYSKFGGDPYL